MSSDAPPRRHALPDLVVRPMEEGDFGACLGLLDGHLGYPDDLLGRLPLAWQRLIDDEALNAIVVEVRDRDGVARLVGLGASVFVDDDWMAEARRGVEPYLTARTIAADMGPRSPVLRPKEIARANETGLNVIILHYSEAPGLSAEIEHALRYRMFEAFVETTRGYRIEEVLQEFWDEIAPEYILTGWGLLRSDHEDYFRRRGEQFPGPGRRPYLIGITREEALANPGAIAAPLFVHTPPRIGFTPAEKRLLRAALSGLTDIELAKALNVRLPTVKSRWRAIYDRLAQQAPEVLQEITPATLPAASRGLEKRRHVLSYLRRHPEELRPGLS